jgi:hypothetical protein
MTAALQLSPADGGPVGLALSVLLAVLGLAVGYVAYRGYRRNESLPMLFVAAGFLLAFLAPPLILGAFVGVDAVASFAPGLRESVQRGTTLAAKATQAVGLLCILWGLWLPRRD